MASSGVWKNVFLAITPTFDGVCRILWFIILDGFFAKIWHICHLLLNLANFFWYFLWQMLLSLFCWQPLDIVGRCCCQLVVMADVFAIVADVKATLFVCVNWQLLNVFVVADVITTLLGWCIYHSGWWNYHIYGLMFYPIIPIGTAMWVTGVMARKTFSHTLDEAMSVGLVKACDLRKNLFCWRENQSLHWKHLIFGHWCAMCPNSWHWKHLSSSLDITLTVD